MIGITPICPYCNKFSALVSGAKMYPHRTDLHKLKFYQCAPCDAYVGCHGSSERPLGRLANAELRKAKSDTHRMFDAIWKEGQTSRSDAYAWLSRAMKIKVEDAHIGKFDIKLCKLATALAKAHLIARSAVS